VHSFHWCGQEAVDCAAPPTIFKFLCLKVLYYFIID
jgi:hypothetical protein